MIRLREDRVDTVRQYIAALRAVAEAEKPLITVVFTPEEAISSLATDRADMMERMLTAITSAVSDLSL